MNLQDWKNKNREGISRVYLGDKSSIEIINEVMNSYQADYIANSFVKLDNKLIQIDKVHVHIYRRTCELLGAIWKCRCNEWRIFFPRLEHDNDTPFDWDRDHNVS